MPIQSLSYPWLITKSEMHTLSHHSTHSTHTVHTQSAHSSHTEHTQHTHCTDTLHTLHALHMYGTWYMHGTRYTVPDITQMMSSSVAAGEKRRRGIR